MSGSLGTEPAWAGGIEPLALMVAPAFFMSFYVKVLSAPLKGRLGCAGASMQRELGTVLCTQKASPQRLCPGLAFGRPPLSRESGADHVLSLRRLLQERRPLGQGGVLALRVPEGSFLTGACDLLQCDCSLNPLLCTLSYRFTLWPPQEEVGPSVNSLDHPGCQH